MKVVYTLIMENFKVYKFPIRFTVSRTFIHLIKLNSLRKLAKSTNKKDLFLVALAEKKKEENPQKQQAKQIITDQNQDLKEESLEANPKYKKKKSKN